MAIDDVTALIGGAAAVCTTVSFVPQLVKIRRQGGRDLSYGMLLLYLVGLALWLVYGLRIQAAEVIAANVVGGSLVVAAIAMKRRAQHAGGEGGRRAGPESDIGPHAN
jgi:MtN3 and saliva related transmembrane protein